MNSIKHDFQHANTGSLSKDICGVLYKSLEYSRVEFLELQNDLKFYGTTLEFTIKVFNQEDIKAIMDIVLNLRGVK